MSRIDDRSFVETVDGKPKGVEKRKRCWRSILSEIEPCDQVWEPFGGIGLLHGTLKEMGWKPKHYEVWEHAADCVERLEQLRRPKPKVLLGDSFFMPVPRARPNALFSLDFNTFTPYRADGDPRFMDFLRRVAEREPRWLQVTESAVSRLHLNLDTYSSFFGKPVTDLESYLLLVSKWFYRHLGYSVRRAAHHHGASYLLMDRTPPKRFKVVKP